MFFQHFNKSSKLFVISVYVNGLLFGDLSGALKHFFYVISPFSLVAVAFLLGKKRHHVAVGLCSRSCSKEARDSFNRNQLFCLNSKVVRA